MSSLVLDIDDWAIAPGEPAYIERLAPYFLLMTGSDVDVDWYHKGTRIGSAKGLQGGDAVGPLSQNFDRVILRSATTQTVKVAISSDPVTITRLSGTVSVSGVVQTGPDYDRSKSGVAFWAANTAQPVSGEYGYVQLWNPAGSGKRMIVPDTYLSVSSGNYNLLFTDVELVAANVNSYLEFKSQSLKVKTPREFSAVPVIKRGTSLSATVVDPAVSPGEPGGAGSFTLDNMKPSLPIVLEPGTGIAARTASTQVLLTMNAAYFEEVV